MVIPLLALVFLRWVCSSLVVPSWKVLGKAPSSMENSGVLSSNRAIRTTWAAYVNTHARAVRRSSPLKEPAVNQKGIRT